MMEVKMVVPKMMLMMMVMIIFEAKCTKDV